ncbi:hypothetical protein RRG08_004655 [Elysia crispata]|uniref:Uncharacterized protein n=1 Tax=Elysia crispata TaxID=231223 RepID=A0AAE0ZQK3_9GAST|nr:hypothetical protein RRG08_004655 [Elysia crispata]
MFLRLAFSSLSTGNTVALDVHLACPHKAGLDTALGVAGHYVQHIILESTFMCGWDQSPIDPRRAGSGQTGQTKLVGVKYRDGWDENAKPMEVVTEYRYCKDPAL